MRSERSFVPIETTVFFVPWLALAILGAGLLLLGWGRLLILGWGWLLARVVGFVFWLAVATFVAGLLILGYEEWKWWIYALVLIVCVVLTFALRRRDEESDNPNHS
jgi:hypothetical protein